MTTSTTPPARLREHGSPERESVFGRVVCGVDHSEAGALAARAAGQIADPGGSLLLLSADDDSIAVHGGFTMPIVAAQLEEDARLALERGTAEATPAHPAETRLVRGDPRYCLLAEVERERATLLVVGSHGQARATGIALGAVATHMLHEAPCPVLVARGTIDPESWPRSIVVGIDGSAESAAAYEAAEALHQRLGGSLRVMVATDSDADVVAARRIAPDVEEHPARPMDMLSVASEGADLLVVGSRGLRGLRSLGSVSERIGHEAKCSVLVVRGGAD